MDSAAGLVKVFVVGVVTIGIITALFAPGRQTTDFTKVAVAGAQGLLSTAETGK